MANQDNTTDEFSALMSQPLIAEQAPAMPTPQTREPAQQSVSTEQQPKKRGGFIERGLNTLNNIAMGRPLAGDSPEGGAGILSGLEVGAVRGVGLAAGGALDFAQDVGRAAGTAINDNLLRGNTERQRALYNAFKSAGLYDKSTVQGSIMSAFGIDGDPNIRFAPILSMQSQLGDVGNDVANQAAAQVSAFAVGFGKIKSLTGLKAGLAGDAAIAGATGAIVQDPHEERFSNMLESLGVKTDFTEWLAHDDSEGAIEGRIKNAIENTGLGLLADGLFATIKGVRAMARGDAKAAAQAQNEARASIAKQIDSTTASLRAAGWQGTETDLFGNLATIARTGVKPRSPEPFALPPHPITVTVEGTPEDAAIQNLDDLFAQHRTATDGSPEALSTTNPAPVPWRDGSPRGKPLLRARPNVAQVAKDGNRALELAGITGERLDPATMKVSADGRIVVSDETKAALDAKNFGKAFTTGRQAILGPGTMIFKASSSEGSRIVGAMRSQDLAVFAADVKALRDTVTDASGRELDVARDSDLGKRVGQFKIGQLGDVTNVAPMLRGLLNMLPKGTKTVRSDADLMVQATVASDEIGLDPTIMLEAGRQIAGQLGDADGAMKTLQTIWARGAADVDELLSTDWFRASDTEVKEAAKRLHNMMTLSAYVTQAKAGLGRGLRAIQLADADTYVSHFNLEGDVLSEALRRDPTFNAVPPRELRPLPQTRQEMADWLELWKATKGDAKARAGFLEGLNTLPSAGKYARTAFANLYTANILSGARTVTLNLLGPAVVGAVRTVEKTSGAFIASLNPLIPKSQRALLMAAAKDVPVAYMQVLGDVGEAFKFAAQSARENKSILGGGFTQDVQRFSPVSTQMLNSSALSTGAQVGQVDRNLYALGNLLNLWPRAFARLNNGLDEFAKRLSYLGEARARAIIAGREQGLHGDELDGFVRSKLTGLTDEAGAATDRTILRAAERTTLTGQVGADDSAARKLSEQITKWRQSVPELRYIMPIWNVSANSIGETLRRIPVANFLLKEHMADLLGKNGVIAQGEAYGRTLLGASFLTGGVIMARMGALTGAGPTNSADRKLWLQTHQPWSIRVGDSWVDYSRYDVVGGLLGIPASVFDATVQQRDDDGWEERTLMAVAALAEYFRDRAAIRTVSDILTIGTQGSNPATILTRLLAGTVGRLAVPSFITDLRRVSDPVARSKGGGVGQSFFNQIADMIPGESMALEPMRNVLGEPIYQPRDTLLENTLPITITPASNYNTDPVIDELDRLYNVTGYAGGVTTYGRAAGKGIDASQVELEDGRSLFDAIVRERMTLRLNGSTLREALSNLFDSDQYDQATDADATVKQDTSGRVSRAYLVRQVFEDYQDAAKRSVAQRSPIAQAWLAVGRAKSVENGALRDYSASDLVRNPDLMQSLGIDVERYKSEVSAY